MISLRHRPLVIALSMSSGLLGCLDGRDLTARPDASVMVPTDAGTITASTPVVSSQVPSRTPYPILPVRGTVPARADGTNDAQYVIIDGLDNPVIGFAVGGPFCIEVLVEPGEHTLTLVSQDRLGNVSESTSFTFVYDPEAPELPQLLDCAGTRELHPCEPTDEVCDNGTDDDCDGIADAQEVVCQDPCGFDYLEPTDDVPPRLQTGVYTNLALCGDRPDSDTYTIVTRHGETLDLNITHTQGTTMVVGIYPEAGGGVEVTGEVTEPFHFQIPVDELLGGPGDGSVDQVITLVIEEQSGLPMRYSMTLVAGIIE